MAKLGGGTLKKKGTLIGTVTQNTSGQVKGMSTRKKSGSLRKAPAKKQGRSMRTQVVDVYGGGSGGGGSRGGGYSSYGKRSGGGYSSYGGGGGGYQDFAAQAAAQAAKEEAEKKARLNAAKGAAEQELKTQLAMIDAAIKSANSQYMSDVGGLENRHRGARDEIDSLYGGLIGDTKSLNQGANTDMAAAQQSATDAANSLVGSIGTRNDETQAGLAQALNAMGLGKGLQQEQVQASEEMALAETQARGDVANTTADYGLMGGTQQAIGNWNVSGLGQDQGRAVTDLNTGVRDQLFDLRRVLAELLAEQNREKLRAKGDYRMRMAELDY